jgi:glycosyltransferase involved in cell wall biosynthesis
VSAPRLRVLFALPGLHRVSRGAEAAFENVARQLARRDDFEITLIGSGTERPGEPYQFRHADLVPRERFEKWPRIPPFRNEYRWEEFSFVRNFWREFHPREFDLTMTCSYPFVNWMLRARRDHARPRHVFVTQNGDWPAQRRNAEYKWFSCDGLVCTNPEYFERQKNTWRCALIPNGMDAARYTPGPADRAAFNIPSGVPVVLMVSALIPSKFVAGGVRAVARLPGVHLVVAGDGPQRDEVDGLARDLLPGRFTRLTTTMDRMPALYRGADVFLHLSRDEAFGNVYIEALATGLPVVGHDYPTARWILGEFGRLVDTTDDQRTADAVQAALAAPRAADARHTFAANRYDWPAVGAQYAAFLKQVASA